MSVKGGARRLSSTSDERSMRRLPAATVAPWRSLGAIPRADGAVDFCVWAPAARRVDVVVERPGRSPEARPLIGEPDGLFRGCWADLEVGAHYRYALDGTAPLPDPASRFQPLGVHGPSAVVDPGAFAWSDQAWTGVSLQALTIYELHVGTFSAAGTFAGVIDHLADLCRLGVTAIELMPVADFPGQHNWGYDGVALFAPARCYGSPDDLRALVDAAHGLGLAVLLDVVYNHLGPDGAYLSRYSSGYFTDRHQSPWGAGVDVEGSSSARVREFFIQNAVHWVHEYHIDGLRLDATHTIRDSGPRHFLAELAGTVRGSVTGRHVHVIAEDDRNLSRIVTGTAHGGWALDGVWADDFHHQVRRHLAGDSDGYYRDYSGSTADIAETLRQGWFYTGQHSIHSGKARGTDPTGVALARFVICLQNHDQVGNRATGDRLHHTVELAAFRAASALLLLAPETPLIFMGQEWAASSPFQYFTDHCEPLGRLVSEGRRREFAAFAAFAEGARQVPDPQAVSTLEASRLRWEERALEPHASILRFYTALLELRQTHVADARDVTVETLALDDETVALRRASGDVAWLVVVRLAGPGDVTLPRVFVPSSGHTWVCLMTSEDAPFATQPRPPVVESLGTGVSIRFQGPAAVVLRMDTPPWSDR